MGSPSRSPSCSASAYSLDDLKISTSFDPFGQEQITIDLDINPVFGVANCRAVFDKDTKKWKLVTWTDAKFADGRRAEWKRTRPSSRASPAQESSAASWTDSLPRSPHVDVCLNGVNWDASPLGPLDSWPCALQTCCHLVFADSRAAVIYWGEDLIAIPNAIYMELVKGRLRKSTDVVGLPFNEIWPELHRDFTPMLAEVAETGRALDQIDINLFPLNPDGTV